jgi:hypothetical protein
VRPVEHAEAGEGAPGAEELAGPRDVLEDADGRGPEQDGARRLRVRARAGVRRDGGLPGQGDERARGAHGLVRTLRSWSDQMRGFLIRLWPYAW